MKLSELSLADLIALTDYFDLFITVQGEKILKPGEPEDRIEYRKQLISKFEGYLATLNDELWVRLESIGLNFPQYERKTR